MKRIFDILFAAAGLIFFSPILVIVSVLIKSTSSGSILFKQLRMGKGFVPFYIYKFRTMVKNAPQTGPSITIQNDCRITPVGKWLRGLRMDELPQLMNVLKGEMSLVGPRPELPHYINRFKNDFESILRFQPGITDWASLVFIDESSLLAKRDNPEEYYLKSILPRKIRLAKAYLQHRSFFSDLAIIVLTFASILSICYPLFFGANQSSAHQFLCLRKICKR